MVNTKSVMRESVAVAAYFAALLLVAAGLWIQENFGAPSFEQIVYHVQFGGAGLRDADIALIRSFVIKVILVPVLLATLLRGLVHAFNTNFLSDKVFIGRAIRVGVPALLFIASAVFFLHRISLPQYIEGSENDGFVDAHYVEPRDIAPPRLKRNLILIYVESLESAYGNPHWMGRDLLAPLADVYSQGLSFEQFVQARGTGWTIAAMVATQCGIPLRPYRWLDLTEPGGRIDGNRLGEKANRFMPGIVCLGDILKRAGYQNVFLGGADPAFAGKGKFLAEHGYDEIHGQSDWWRVGESEMNGWGLYDDRLFARALDRLDDLVQDGRPFNLTLLTLDMHHPDGFISQTCRERGVRDFPGIVECGAQLLVEFVQDVGRKGYLESTDVVILGDHLSMVNPLHETLLQVPERTIFNLFLSSRSLQKNRERITHFSIFPTLLDMLGFSLEGRRLGLGASGFGAPDPSYVVERTPDLNARLAGRSELYRKFWKEDVR